MHPRELAIADYTYTLPADRIAQQPLADRAASRLLVWRDGAISDKRFGDLVDELPEGALLVLNNTRVVNARLVFQRSTGARIEVLCLAPKDGRPVELALNEPGTAEWSCFIGNSKRWNDAEVLTLGAEGFRLHATRTGTEAVRFDWDPPTKTFAQVLAALGHVPLPPYMKRADVVEDRTRYNTVFARKEGSVAAPTASLHFTPGMLEALRAKQVRMAELTLHVGAGTFLPVKSARMHDHAMHSEEVSVPRTAITELIGQLGRGPVVAVGTTALRTLESLYWHGARLLRGQSAESMDVEQWEPYAAKERSPGAAEALQAVADSLEERRSDSLSGRTRLLIAPGYRFRIADALITNFHQPQSTLLLLVAAFIGDGWRSMYEHALANGYRFLSYGDGSLLWRRP